MATHESPWFAQLMEMREALQQLMKSQLPTMPRQVNEMLLDEDDLSGTGVSDSVFDNIDDFYSSSSDFLEEDGVVDHDGGLYGREWLTHQCIEYCSRRGGNALEPDELASNLLALLSSNTNNAELQSSLTDILGYEDLELVEELILHRETLLRSVSTGSNQRSRGKAELADDIILRLMTKEQREEALKKQDLEHKSKPLGPKFAEPSLNYPHIYRSHDAGNTLSAAGKKYSLPIGSRQEENEKYKYQEIIIPAAEAGKRRFNEKPVFISEMDKLCQNTFKGYKSLNRMQSLLYEVAYKTNENMLICAPTGAGKTDAAMLTILNVIARNCEPSPLTEPDAQAFLCQKDDFKIIYVAPMKALASEVVEKLGKRLDWLGIEVRELTGDMHLTKAEILRTQIIVTTPEKWDVVTRKSTGDVELVQKVRLLIIDEVHMLHDERGAVIESIVARTERQVESTQSMIRIVGLSATLPNYVDVASFLRVNPFAGLFYFDASFRPVPLEQHFVGVRGKAGSKQSNENLDRAAFEKVKEMLKMGHQVMVFVHSRKDTVRTARRLYEMAQDDQCWDLFDPQYLPRYPIAVQEMNRSKARELRDLFPKGFGVHHAGMLRSDRNSIERLFGEGLIKVLCCTATLAWGVNLPAAAVVIRGTQLYSSQKGTFVDLGILDVLQIFGRAGRPQFQQTGVGYICTTIDKLPHYLSAVTQQHPIESRLAEKIIDNLNAEIALGTVTTVHEGVQWLGYSYMFVRWKKNPLGYGIDWQEFHDDPTLTQRRRSLIIKAAKHLQNLQMIIYNETTESLSPKDLGRIASNFYILNTSIEIFNNLLKPTQSEADILSIIALSGEFDNIQSRDNEAQELMMLRENDCPCEIPGKSEDTHVKTNILLQAYISRANLEDFALVSDSAYVAQNAARICRALFMIALNRRWGHLCHVLLSMGKSIEKRIWSFQHPLAQFGLPHHIVKKLEEKESTSSIQSLREMQPGEIGNLVNNQTMGYSVSKVLDNFPDVSIEVEIAPLNRDVLRVKLWITPEFKWNDKIHGKSESFWIWVENSDTSEIYHSEFFILTKKKLYDEHELNFTIPLSDPLPSQIYVRASSDRWLGVETVEAVSFQHLIRPDTESVYTELLDLQPLPITALKNPVLEELYGQRFRFFNPMQTQIFHTLYHTSENVLLGSPTGSGKTIACELAMWQAFRDKPGSKVVYIAPMKALVRERVKDWKGRITGPMDKKLVELTGDNTPDTRTISDADIIITTPEKWDGISRSWQTRDYVKKVSLVIIDEIHLLGGDRGPILEIIVSRMNYIASQTEGSVRLMGMSTACANASDLGDWLGVKKGLYNFRHSVRPVPLEIFIDGFPEQSGFCPLMQSMNRPAFLAIKTHSPTKPVIIFVASRRQTRLTARDLIASCGLEDDPRRFLHMPEPELDLHLEKVKDASVKEALSFGIGLHHAGLVESDRQLVEELFTFNKIQVLVATSTLAWGVNLPAHLVVVKGTQFFDAKTEGYKDMDLTDVLQMLGRAGRPQFDSSGIARIFTQDAKKEFYKYFLHTGFPVESSLHKVVDDHLGAEIAAGTIRTKQDALDYLTWTFFFRRLHKNPTYYGLEINLEDHDSSSSQLMANNYMVHLVNKSVDQLQRSGCAITHSNGDLDSTPLGKIASYYYLSHKTVRNLLKRAKPNATFEDALAWMCTATEYDELPVRHNEDLINVELSKNLPFKAQRLNLPLWDPHVKAFLLIQAFMSRINLPISDYITDQNSVLDQSIRIIQASIDILAELGYLSSCLMMISLLECIKQARWPTDGPLSILPGVEVSEENKRIEDGTMPPASLVELPTLPPPTLQDIVRLFGIPRAHQSSFHNAVAAIPDLAVKIVSASPDKVEITLIRKNPALNPDFRIYAPRFPKTQTEGWFVILGDVKSGSIYALKRVGWPLQQKWTGGSGFKSIANTTLMLPPGFRPGMSLTAIVVSDGYQLEIRQEVHIS
ncbi:Sec63 Brl domain-containing protein [Terfezia claveryi]|nr:Sec63 Brl domain-containing protein [Terfezia claveryi]